MTPFVGLLLIVPRISLEFRKLGQQYREVISDICHRMGMGMAEFLEKKVGSMKEWDLAASLLLGILPTTMVSSTNRNMVLASWLADPEVGQDTELANSMGHGFLQKTNIIRDYLEDTQQGRVKEELACHVRWRLWL
ncbi:unnamed protein product [Arctogadus glacialis]